MSEKGRRQTQRERWASINWAKQWGWQMCVTLYYSADGEPLTGRFNVNLGTGAVSIVIGNVPYRFNGQHALGTSIQTCSIDAWFSSSTRR